MSRARRRELKKEKLSAQFKAELQASSAREDRQGSNEPLLTFSFQFLQPDHQSFQVSNCSVEFLRHLVGTIAEYSRGTVSDFKVVDMEIHHRHMIDFSQTFQPEGFGLDPMQVGSDEPWQFGLCNPDMGSDGAWRVHGFFRGNVFFVVWLDYHHALTSNAGYYNRGRKPKKNEA